MRIISVIIAAIVALLLVLGWLSWHYLGDGQGRVAPGGEATVDPMADPMIEPGEMAVDSLARIQVAALEEQILRLGEQLAALSEEVLALRIEIQRLGAPTAPEMFDEGEGAIDGGRGPGIDDYAGLVLIPDRRNVNAGLTVASPQFLEDFLGRPRERLSDRCEPMTNPRLQGLLRLEEVGPIRVRMLEPAIESLRGIFEKVRAMDPDLYDRISTAGSLCVRQIRGSVGRTSSHAFGLSLDINIDGHLDVLADGKTQLGLLLMSDLFRAEKWIWGAGFTREDSMHFEVSRELLEAWREDGRI